MTRLTLDQIKGPVQRASAERQLAKSVPELAVDFVNRMKANPPEWKPPRSAKPRRAKGMNKAEARFAEYLERRGILYQFEAVKFRLGDRCYYTPDFYLPRGFWAEGGFNPTFVEVKAWWEKASHVGWREDARVKFKAAAERYKEFGWEVVWWRPDFGKFEYEFSSEA